MKNGQMERLKKKSFGENFFGDKGVRTVFLIGLIITIIAISPISRKIEQIRLDRNGVITEGQVIGTWQLFGRRPFAVYMFPIDSIHYRTGAFSFPHGSIVEEGDRVRVRFLERNPYISRVVEFIVD